jgi:hypothetical protein
MTTPHMDPLQVALAIAGGVSIAAACGLRAFLPLLALSLAGRFGLVHLNPHAAVISSDTAIVMLAIATVLEMAADKIPVLDHALDVLGTFVRPAAAALAGWAAFGALHPALSLIVAIVLGTGALGVHLLKAKTRLGSTALTLGHANPLLSVGEDVVSAGLAALAILAPLAALLVLVLAIVWFVRRSAARRRAIAG